MRAVANERVGERVDRFIIRPLHPARQIRIFVERNGIHFRAQTTNEPRQRNGISFRVVVAREQDVLDRDLASFLSRISTQRRDQLIERIFLRDRHDLFAPLPVRRIDRHRKRLDVFGIVVVGRRHSQGRLRAHPREHAEYFVAYGRRSRGGNSDLGSTRSCGGVIARTVTALRPSHRITSPSPLCARESSSLRIALNQRSQ